MDREGGVSHTPPSRKNFNRSLADQGKNVQPMATHHHRAGVVHISNAYNPKQ
jgi:hypothetical protein